MQHSHVNTMYLWKLLTLKRERRWKWGMVWCFVERLAAMGMGIMVLTKSGWTAHYYCLFIYLGKRKRIQTNNRGLIGSTYTRPHLIPYKIKKRGWVFFFFFLVLKGLGFSLGISRCIGFCFFFFSFFFSRSYLVHFFFLLYKRTNASLPCFYFLDIFFDQFYFLDMRNIMSFFIQYIRSFL